MDHIQCNFCKKLFYRKRSQVLLAKKHYCSVTCQNDDKKKGQIFSCHLCHRKVYKKNKDINKSKGKNFFCSIQCSNSWLGSRRRGRYHPNWIDGSFSYKNILSRTSVSGKCRLCQETDRRVLAVHHLDRDRTNNSVSNLIWLCHNCHFLAHHDAGEVDKLTNLVNRNGHQ